MGERLDFRGAAAKCTATLDVGVPDTTIGLTGDTSGWPTGATGRKFMATIDRGVANKMEKVLCSDLTAGVLTIDTRGYDGTTAIAHDAGATVEHGLGASVIDDLSAHVYDTTRNDHTQYDHALRYKAGRTTGTTTAIAPGESKILVETDADFDVAYVQVTAFGSTTAVWAVLTSGTQFEIHMAATGPHAIDASWVVYPVAP